MDVRCVVCEFSANVECVQLAALAPQLGPARHVGRGPWLRAQSLASPGVERGKNRRHPGGCHVELEVIGGRETKDGRQQVFT